MVLSLHFEAEQFHATLRSSGTISAGFQADCHPWPAQGAWQTRGRGEGGEESGWDPWRRETKKKKGRLLNSHKTLQ